MTRGRGSRDGVMKNECADEQSMITPLRRVTSVRSWPTCVVVGLGMQSRDRRYDNIHDFVSLVSELIQTARTGSRGQDHADIAREMLQEELPQECVVCGPLWQNQGRGKRRHGRIWCVGW